jgi:putative phosphoesterase
VAVTARIGVVADTHVGEWVAELPDAVLAALAGVDVILHSGDITDLSLLDRLATVAPVVAVQGDHDRAAGIVLPRSRVVEIAGYRIGLTHGRRWRAIELAGALVSLALGRPVLMGFHRALRRRFGQVDAVVFGHLHLPCTRWIGGVLFFSPGAVHNAEHAPGFAAGGISARAYLRFRESLPADDRVLAVGILEAGPDGLAPRIVPVAPDGTGPLGAERATKHRPHLPGGHPRDEGLHTRGLKRERRDSNPRPSD